MNLVNAILLSSAESGNFDFVVKSLNRHADINVTNTQGMTPVMIAAICQHEKIVSHLIKVGADISMKDHFGNTLDNYLNHTDHFPSHRLPLKKENISEKNKDSLDEMAAFVRSRLAIFEIEKEQSDSKITAETRKNKVSL